VADEDAVSFGYGAEIAARIGSQLFDKLDAPVGRVGTLENTQNCDAWPARVANDTAPIFHFTLNQDSFIASVGRMSAHYRLRMIAETYSTLGCRFERLCSQFATHRRRVPLVSLHGLCRLPPLKHGFMGRIQNSRCLAFNWTLFHKYFSVPDPDKSS